MGGTNENGLDLLRKETSTKSWQNRTKLLGERGQALLQDGVVATALTHSQSFSSAVTLVSPENIAKFS